MMEKTLSEWCSEPMMVSNYAMKLNNFEMHRNGETLFLFVIRGNLLRIDHTIWFSKLNNSEVHCSG